MRGVNYYAGTILMGLGDLIQSTGESLVEVGHLIRVGVPLPVPVRRPHRVPPRHPMHQTNGELDDQL